MSFLEKVEKVRAVLHPHYARWTGGDAYRSALEVGEDEVPADLLARLTESRHGIPHSAILRVERRAPPEPFDSEGFSF
jgi:hypothetical protein